MDSTTVIVTQVATLITVIIGFLVALYREKRNRQWDLEDRTRAREEVLNKADTLKEESEKRHKAIGDKLTKILENKFQDSPEVQKLLKKLDEEIKNAEMEALRTVSEVKNEITRVKQITSNSNEVIHSIDKKIGGENEPKTDKSGKSKR